MNQEIRRLRQSFACALRGVMSCVRHERNFRIHITAACYVAAAAILCRLPVTQCAVLCLCFAMMMSAELMNTAIERLSDKSSTGYDRLVREAKDIAAAAVVVCALFCVVVGALFFLPGGHLIALWEFFCAHLWALGLVLLTIPAALWFVFLF